MSKRKSRRKRSEMSIDEANAAIAKFAQKVCRMSETSSAGTFRTIKDDEINVMFIIKGNFGAATDMFEATRVLGGHKLPRKDT